MPEGMIQQGWLLLADVIPGVPLDSASIGLIGAAAGGAILLLIAWVWLSRRKPKSAPVEEDLTVRIASLPAEGPSKMGEGPQLEYLHIPVRLAVLVLAPVGKNSTLPPPVSLREILDELIPGLMGVVDRHQPIFRRWPRQLSWQGFAQAFFRNLPLPGERGKGTPWCSVAGRFNYRGTPLLAGMVLCADKPNGHSHLVIEQEPQWIDSLRVRG